MAIVTRTPGTKSTALTWWDLRGTVGYEPLICADDGEAIGKAKRLAGQYPGELWSGPMLVSSLPKQRAGAVTHEIQQGRMVPKPAM
jgi:hypothetical protein